MRSLAAFGVTTTLVRGSPQYSCAGHLRGPSDAHHIYGAGERQLGRLYVLALSNNNPTDGRLSI